jgi:hypothetical protein
MYGDKVLGERLCVFRDGTIEGDDLLIHGNCFCMTVANKPL